MLRGSRSFCVLCVDRADDYTLSASARIVASDALFNGLTPGRGDLWNDTWRIGSAALDDYTFGVENAAGSNPTRVLGLAGLEDALTMNRTAAMLPPDGSSVRYPSVPAAMAAAGHIPTAAYSLWLGPLGEFCLLLFPCPAGRAY